MTVLSSCSTNQHPISSPEWRSLTATTRVEASFTSGNSSHEITGISLVHLVDKSFATAGDRLAFSVWVLNATSETLWDISLVPRSLTNSRLESLQYEIQPPQNLMKNRLLGPRRSLQYSFSYVLTPRDAEEPGELISALSVEANSESWGKLYSECDAIVSMR